MPVSDSIISLDICCITVYTARVCPFFFYGHSFFHRCHNSTLWCHILTFRGPCNVIYCCNKTNETHYFTNLFWYRTLHVSDRFTVHHQESSTVYKAIGICHTGYADCLLEGSGWMEPVRNTQSSIPK